ncbi:hypothetical protein EJB05_00683, partial [Eragrostis curvula]
MLLGQGNKRLALSSGRRLVKQDGDIRQSSFVIVSRLGLFKAVAHLSIYRVPEKKETAMEAALVSGILKIVGMNLAPLITKEFGSIAGVTKDLEHLQDLVAWINDWLEMVGDKAIRNEKSSNWLKRLKDVAYDAEDLVHEFHMEAEKLDVNIVGLNNTVIKYLWAKPKSVVFKCKIAYKIKEIKKKFDAIVKGRSDYSTITNSMAVDHHTRLISKTIGEVPSLTNVDETSIFGRDQLKLRLISELMETNNQHKIKIVSVIGLGGSGKTTLAKLVYNGDNIIKEHFEVKLWVHVSREFDVEKLVQKLFEAIDGDKAENHASQRMSTTISNKLVGKKFLIFLDDVWTEDRIQWEQFMVNLRGGAPGSSILLTTRSRKVAEAVDSTYICDLPFLSKKDSWKVFLQSFGRAMEGLDPEFRKVGTEIVNKCSGVPLAIKVLASVLRGMKTIIEWQTIRDSNLLDVEEDQRRVSNCLFLSYVHLPHHLRHCFTHCSIFPRGHAINKNHLISQWIAHGFINLTNEAQHPEDVGINYFESLLNVGFFQDLEHHKSEFREETTCKLHDLLHDLSRQILHDEFVSGTSTTHQIRRCRYASLTSGTREFDSKLFDKVRALYISGGGITFGKPMNKTCRVRTIILERIRAASLPLFVSKFEHLGYLEISYINCEALPNAISDCSNLQAIHVIRCGILATLPESIGRLKKLRVLEFKYCSSVRSLPQSLGGCDNLQSLYLSHCGLKDIPDSVANINKLRVLSVVHCLSLQRLLPSEFFGKLCNLGTITISDCRDLQCLPQCISLLSHIEHVDLTRCRNLEELPEGIGNLTKLQVLNLQQCYGLRGLPAGCGQLTRLRKLGLFVVGDSVNHARISELENLDKINGELQITNINNVKDPCDAEKVHLKKTIGIRELSLDWYSRRSSWVKDALEESVEVRTEEELLPDMEKDLYLLNCLEPPRKIKRLRVSGYRGSQLPRWMMKPSDSCVLNDMHMPKQSSSPQFSHLTKLVLEDLPNLEHLQGLVDLSGIKILELRRMAKLAELLTTRTSFADEEEGEVQYCFPSLSDLVISDCPILTVKPWFPLSLKRLTFEGGNEQLQYLGSFFNPGHADEEPTTSSCTMDAKSPHLTELKLGRLRESSSGWDVLQHLAGLHVLKIDECKDLKQLPESMRSLTCLCHLKITYCNNLCMLPEWLGELQSLKYLQIREPVRCIALMAGAIGPTTTMSSKIDELLAQVESMMNRMEEQEVRLAAVEAKTPLPAVVVSSTSQQASSSPGDQQTPATRPAEMARDERCAPPAIRVIPIPPRSSRELFTPSTTPVISPVFPPPLQPPKLTYFPPVQPSTSPSILLVVAPLAQRPASPDLPPKSSPATRSIQPPSWPSFSERLPIPTVVPAALKSDQIRLIPAFSIKAASHGADMARSDYIYITSSLSGKSGYMPSYINTTQWKVRKWQEQMALRSDRTNIGMAQSAGHASKMVSAARSLSFELNDWC